MRTHWLKIWPEFYREVKAGRKTFEVRCDDRGFMVDDKLILKEYDPAGCAGAGEYTDREIEKTVTYKMYGGKHGLDPNYCILGLSRNGIERKR